MGDVLERCGKEAVGTVILRSISLSAPSFPTNTLFPI